MSDQYGMYAPPPEVPGMPPAEEPAEQPTVKKRKTGLIIGIVVGVIVALCGCSVFAGAIFLTSGDSGTVTENPFIDSYDDSFDASDDDRLAEWLAWDPIVGAELPAPPSGNTALLDDAMAILAPGFTVTDVGYSAGWVDVIEDWYYGDLYLVRATHPASSDVYAAIEFTVQSQDMIDDDVSFEVDEDEVVDSIAGGTVEMISYGPFENPDFPLDSAEGEALWQAIGEDWPDAVVMAIWTDSSSEVTVLLTKWRQYNIEDYSPRVWASYELTGDTWQLTWWEYEDDDESYETDETPVI